MSVLVVPRSSRDGILGLHDDRVRVALQAPPVDGAANKALIAFFARLFGVRKGDVEIRQGTTGRRKRVRIQRLRPEEAIERLG